ncbi:protein sel-1 homolog 3-like protein [Lates japonicus]|uniref:Protein sel-1 homolog 3-like protein n=1 Tax=Lates japonicus TaxID=270547 RepID=A0AAD3REG7_LATJO|nr:protein sel-1 homolog 3-like protein [Lates japonicus]
MNKLRAIIFGYVLTAAIMGECVLQAISSKSGESQPDNFIGFDSAPDKVVDGSVVRVRYQCPGPCQLAVEVVVSTLRKTDLVVFRRKWISSTPRAYRIHQITRSRISQCPHESDIIDVLKFPLASTGEHFGVVRRFQPFIDGALEGIRLHAVTQPSVTLSVWIYLLKWCQKKHCGIIHHVDRKTKYDSVLMQLTDIGGSQQLVGTPDTS